ncbi:MAG: radical SAM protein [Proteobacteria bacterium]|nr:radical SAM protein [Pseudomonadota bacterium]
MSDLAAPRKTHWFVKENAAGLSIQRAPKLNPEKTIAGAVGERFNEYRREWQRTETFSYVPDYPLHLDVDTNYTCNLRCSMCPHGAPGKAIKYEHRLLDFNLYWDVIRDGAEKGLAAVRLGMTGEPLLRRDIVDFVDAARQAGLVDIMLISNGMLLTPELSSRLIDAGLTRLQVSLDAVTQETYQKLRQGGCLETVKNNIEEFLKIRDGIKGKDIPVLRVSFVRTSVNAHEQDAFEDYWEPHANYVSIQEYADLVGTPESMALIPADRKVIDEFRCPDPFQRMALFVNGDLFGCCSDHGREYPWGNAFQDDVGAVWRSDTAERLRDLHVQGHWWRHPACRACGLASVARLPAGAD